MKYLIFLLSIIPLNTTPSLAIHNEPLEIIGVNNIARITCYNDYGITASGEITRPGIIATSDRSILMGTKVYVEGYGIMEVKDKTAKWVHEKHGLTFNIYDKDCTREFGVKMLSYVIIE